MKRILLIFYLCMIALMQANAQHPCNISTSYTFIQHGDSVYFEAKNASDSSGNYFWNFSDGNIGYGPKVLHTYSVPGKYIVCLTLDKSNWTTFPYDSCIAFYCDTINIEPADCNIQADYTSIRNGNTISFYGNASDSSGSYSWVFEDGTTQYGQNVTHAFPSPGTYNVCMTYSAPRPYGAPQMCTIVRCDSVSIPAHNCNLTTGFTSAQNGSSVNFRGNGSDSSGIYRWSFNDGTVAYGKNVTHNFTTPGTYPVCLTFSMPDPTSQGDTCTGLFCDTIIVGSVPCNVSTRFDASVNGASADLYGYATDTAGHYFWDLGNGSMSTGQHVQHTYAASGNYTVCLTYLKTNFSYPYDTCKAYFCQNIPVRLSDCNVQATFTTSQSGNSVYFYGHTSDSSGYYIWNHGDGAVSYTYQSPNVHHSYAAPGTYIACMTYVSIDRNNPYDTCFATFCDTIEVQQVNTCKTYASFTSSVNGASAFFYANPSDSTGYYIWNLGDGATATGRNIQHTYASPGQYIVCLTHVSTNRNFPYDTCMAYVCDTIEIRSRCNVSTAFNYSLKNRSAKFNASGSSGHSANYLWNFGDGVTGSGKNVMHTYDSAGYYTICLTLIEPNASHDTCTAFFCDSIYIPNDLKKHHKPVVKVYPMPASHQLHYELSDEGHIGADAIIEILNYSGEVVKRTHGRDGNLLNIEELHPGLYILRIITNEDVYLKDFLKN